MQRACIYSTAAQDMLSVLHVSRIPTRQLTAHTQPDNTKEPWVWVGRVADSCETERLDATPTQQSAHPRSPSEMRREGR